MPQESERAFEIGEGLLERRDFGLADVVRRRRQRCMQESTAFAHQRESVEAIIERGKQANVQRLETCTGRIVASSMSRRRDANQPLMQMLEQGRGVQHVPP